MSNIKKIGATDESSVLKYEVNKLFDYCDQLNKSLDFVDGYTQFQYQQQVKEQGRKVFTMLENRVNSMSTKNFLKDNMDRQTSIKLLFVILKSLYLFGTIGIQNFQDDRCLSSSMLGYKLMYGMEFKNKFGQSKTWLNNDVLFKESIMHAMVRVHPTLMQSIVRCLVETLKNPDIRGEKVPDYMVKFEKGVFYYLMKCPEKDRIVLEYV